MKPIFSVILPTYNRASIISNAIESVRRQLFTDWELIIIDDGSNDNTKDVVNNFDDTRIKYFHQENAERSVARNNGISKAQGEFICFLDSDDEYLNDHLDELYKTITRNSNKKGIYVSCVIREENGTRTELPFQDKASFSNDISFLLLADETIIPARVAIEKKVLESFRFNPNLRISEDTELFTRILCHYPLIQLKKATVVYKLHEDNTTNLKNNPFLGQLKALKLIFKNREIKRYIALTVKHKKIGICYWGIARYHIEQGNIVNSIYSILLSVFYAPTSIGLKVRLYGIYLVLIKK